MPPNTKSNSEIINRLSIFLLLQPRNHATGFIWVVMFFNAFVPGLTYEIKFLIMSNRDKVILDPQKSFVFKIV